MLYDHPELYDALLPSEGHAAYYTPLAHSFRGAVVERGWGSAHLRVPLARPGRPVAGLDRSRPMLDAARRRASAAGAQIEFIEADMQAFDLGRRFGLIFI